MATRLPARGRTALAQAALLAGSLVGLGGACSENARYRALSFFFDGVPPPGAATAPAAVEPGREPTAVEPAFRRPRASVFAHTPYKENACGRCHNMEEGRLVREVTDGLCLSCHAGLTMDRKFVHGPVAVNDCLFCHHHHAAPYPQLLLDEPPALCLQCHDRGDLGAGEHHAKLDEVRCTSCHDPHGGSDRFFLERTDR